MTDVRLFHTDDGGEIEFAGPGDPTTDLKMDTGLETAVYLSWFGGNERDPGLRNNDSGSGHLHKYRWWGNLDEPQPRQMTSETGHLLRSLPATSNNLLRIEDAAKRDLQWMLDDNTATEVEAFAMLMAKDRIRLRARVLVRGEYAEAVFDMTWGE